MNKEQIDKQIDRRAEEIEKLRVQVNKLQIQVDCLTEELQHQKDTPGTTEIDRALLSPGDRIQILNAVKRPKNWNAAKPWIHLEAKRATVTCVEYDRIYFTTMNGISTWRLRKNVLRIPSPPWASLFQ